MKGRILLVDDDGAFRLSTAALLRQDGHDVVAVATGREAAEVVEAGPQMSRTSLPLTSSPNSNSGDETGPCCVSNAKRR